MGAQGSRRCLCQVSKFHTPHKCSCSLQSEEREVRFPGPGMPYKLYFHVCLSISYFREVVGKMMATPLYRWQSTSLMLPRKGTEPWQNLGSQHHNHTPPLPWVQGPEHREAACQALDKSSPYLHQTCSEPPKSLEQTEVGAQRAGMANLGSPALPGICVWDSAMSS